MTAVDPRLTPARADLAAKHLEGTVRAARYVEGTLREVVEPQAPLRRAPSPDAGLLTEALMGERVTVYETTDEGWAWGQLAGDKYVGWMPANALSPPGPPPTHRVSALRTLLFPGPDIKLPPLAALPFGARLALARHSEHFQAKWAPVRVEKMRQAKEAGAGSDSIESEPAPRPFAVTAAGYVPAQHVEPIDVAGSDFVALAERFVGTPYLWGGKTSLGIDCSGLVQVALTACGISCPRDSDMQERALGTPVAGDRGLSALRRGDLVFWKGHVAIVRDPATLLHANVHHMAVAVEPLAPALDRIRRAGSEVTSVKRL